MAGVHGGGYYTPLHFCYTYRASSRARARAAPPAAPRRYPRPSRTCGACMYGDVFMSGDVLMSGDVFMSGYLFMMGMCSCIGMCSCMGMWPLLRMCSCLGMCSCMGCAFMYGDGGITIRNRGRGTIVCSTILLCDWCVRAWGRWGLRRGGEGRVG